MTGKQVEKLKDLINDSKNELSNFLTQSHNHILKMADKVSEAVLFWGKMLPIHVEVKHNNESIKEPENDFSVFLGRKGTVIKTILEEDLNMFKEISLDDNRLHFDEEYAKSTRFKKRIAHGFLTTSLISGAVGAKLFTENIVYKNQSFEFVRPVYIGDTITASAEVVEVDGNVLKLSTTCVNQDGKTVIRGMGEIMIHGSAAETK